MGNHALRCRFILYWLRYLVDYEDWITVENATSWSDKANNSPFCNAVQLQWGKNLKFSRLGNNIKSEESRHFLFYGSPLTPFLTYPNFQLLHLNLIYLSHKAFGIELN